MIESIEGITYDGARLSDLVGNIDKEYIVVNYVGGRSLPTADYQTTKIRAGHEYFTEFGASPREIYADLTIKGRSFADLRRIIDRLGSVLYRHDDVEIAFDDEPGRAYFGRYVSMDENLEESHIAQVRIYFLCLDRNKYGAEQTYSLSRVTTIANDGTAESYPVFDLEVTEDSTLIKIVNRDNLTPSGDGRMIILGQPQEVEQESVDPKTLVMHDTMRSTSGWQTASQVDTGNIVGQMGVDNKGFFVEEYDDEKGDRWHGPSLIKPLPRSIGDFEVNVLLENENTTTDYGVGIIEVYLRDANGRVIAKSGFGNSTLSDSQNKAGVTVNGSKFNRYVPGGWNDFDGLLRIDRGDFGYDRQVRAYWTELKNGRHLNSRFLNYHNSVLGNVQHAPLDSIQIAIRKYKHYDTFPQWIKEIKIYELNEVENVEEQVPISFKKGDKIHIDVAKNLVLLNGEYAPHIIHLDTDFFSIIEGINTIGLSNNVTGSVSFRNRYL